MTQRELNKMVAQAQAKVWTVLFSFYAVHDKSPELRAIRYAIEKSSKKDAIELYLNIKDSVVKSLSVDLQRTTLDEVFIAPNDLAQVFIIVYGEAAVTKTYLLRTVQSRSDIRGTCAGDLVAVLLIDFLKTRENNIKAKNRPKDMENLSFLNNKAKNDIMNRFNLKFETEKEQPADPSVQAESKAASPLTSPRKNARGISATMGAANYASRDSVGSTNQPDGGKRTSAQANRSVSAKTSKLRASSKSATLRERRNQGSDQKQQTQTHDLPVEKTMNRKELKVIEFKREDLARQLDYIVQSKSKSEQGLVNCLSLLKKNNGDYNQLLKYATDIKTSMTLLHSKLTRARDEQLSELTKRQGTGRVRERLDSGDLQLPEPPVADKVVKKYAALLEGFGARTTKSEIQPLIQKFADKSTPVLTVSETAPKYINKAERAKRAQPEED